MYHLTLARATLHADHSDEVAEPILAYHSVMITRSMRATPKLGYRAVLGGCQSGSRYVSLSMIDVAVLVPFLSLHSSLTTSYPNTQYYIHIADMPIDRIKDERLLPHGVYKPPADKLSSASSTSVTSQRRRTNSMPALVSPHESTTIPEESYDLPQPLQAEKEFDPEANDRINSVEYSRYKHSIDHSVTTNSSHIRPDKQIPGKVVVSNPWSRNGFSEVVPPHAELPGEQQLHDEEIVGEVHTLSRKVSILKKKRLWAAVAFILVCALAGGLAGGLHTRRNSASMTVSMDLCAVNWTSPSVDNPEGVSRHMVFTQDSDGSLIAYAGTVNSWTKVNITERFSNSSLPIKLGSPLTAVAMSDPKNLSDPNLNQLHVYFTTSTSSVMEIVTSDPNLIYWKQGTLGPYMNHSLNIGAASQLASTWRRCQNATECGLGQFFLMYETDDQKLMVANSTNNWDPSLAIDRVDSDSTGIALFSVQSLPPQPVNVSDYAWAIYQDGGRLATAWQDYESDWEWTDKSACLYNLLVECGLIYHFLGKDIGMSVKTLNTQSLAVTSFQDRNHVFLAVVDNNGTINGNHWDPEPYRWLGGRVLDLVDNPATVFSTVTLTSDTWLYGMTSDGKLLAFAMDPQEPYRFYFQNEVS